MTSTAPATTFPLEQSSGGTSTLWLESPHQSVVVVDRIMLARLDATLDALRAEPPSLLIIRSRDQRVWVAGADLKEIDSLSNEELEHYLADGQRVFAKISDLPFPVIAAVCGATLGGGLELAMHCHGIVATTTSMRGKPYAIGLPEASLGLVPAWGGTQLLPARVAPDQSVPAIASGTAYTSDAMPEDLVDATVDSENELEAACVALASSINPTDLPRTIASCDEEMVLAAVDHIRHDPNADEAARVVAHCISTGVKNGLAAGLDMEREGLVSLRATEYARAKLQAFLS